MGDGGGWGARLRDRARALGLTDSEVARRLDLTPRRYSSYVNETREPHFRDLLRICRALSLTPDHVLGARPVDPAEDTEQPTLAALRAMPAPARRLALAAVEAMAKEAAPVEARCGKAPGGIA